MRCSKVKNPCKLCFQPVTKKNGLQCQGACKKWAHYRCLNFTPGKIQDIKAGLIEISCPCPDCNITLPKEKLVNPPFTCTNNLCPANKLPACSSKECPSNPDFIPTCQGLPPFDCSANTSPPRPPPSKCVKKTPSPPQIQPKRKQKVCEHHTSKLMLIDCSPPPSPPVCKAQKLAKPCPKFCPSHQLMENKKKTSCPAKESQSCSNLSNYSDCSENDQMDNLRTSSSDSKIPNNDMDQQNLYGIIENLCNTFNDLSHQLKDIMCRINRN